MYGAQHAKETNCHDIRRHLKERVKPGSCAGAEGPNFVVTVGYGEGILLRQRKVSACCL